MEIYSTMFAFPTKWLRGLQIYKVLQQLTVKRNVFANSTVWMILEKDLQEYQVEHMLSWFGLFPHQMLYQELITRQTCISPIVGQLTSRSWACIHTKSSSWATPAPIAALELGVWTIIPLLWMTAKCKREPAHLSDGLVLIGFQNCANYHESAGSILLSTHAPSGFHCQYPVNIYFQGCMRLSETM